jgi:hypothetical protein
VCREGCEALPKGLLAICSRLQRRWQTNVSSKAPCMPKGGLGGRKEKGGALPKLLDKPSYWSEGQTGRHQQHLRGAARVCGG